MMRRKEMMLVATKTTDESLREPSLCSTTDESLREPPVWSIKKAVSALIYIAVAAGMVYLNEDGIVVGGFGIVYKYVIGLFITASAFLIFMVKPDLDRMKILAKYVVVLSSPYLVTIFYSLFVWAFQFTPFRYITRGISFSLYQMIAIATAASLLYIFGENGVWCYFAALMAANAIWVFQAIRESGFSEFLDECITLLTSFGKTTGEVMSKLELHDPTFGIGLFLIFILACNRKIRCWWAALFLGLLFFVTGLKRMAVFGVCLALLIFFVLKVIPEKARRVCIYIACSIVIAVCCVYIGVVRSGLFAYLTAKFDIDTKGRVELYSYIEQFFTLEPTYMGHGLGYVSRMVSQTGKEISRVLEFNGYQPGEIHNDIVRMYIEVGFWGFGIWIYTAVIFRIRFFMQKQGLVGGMLILAYTCFIFMTYMSDNTYYYYCTNTSFAILAMCYGLKAYEERERLERVRAEQVKWEEE